MLRIRHAAVLPSMATVILGILLVGGALLPATPAAQGGGASGEPHESAIGPAGKSSYLATVRSQTGSFELSLDLKTLTQVDHASGPEDRTTRTPDELIERDLKTNGVLPLPWERGAYASAATIFPPDDRALVPDTTAFGFRTVALLLLYDASDG